METFSMQSSALTPIPSSLPRNGLAEKSSGYSQILRFPSSKKLSQTRKVKFADVKASASGATNIRSPEVGATAAKEDSKDGNLAFVAGATGKVGSRTVRELLKLGFRVRAGVRSAKRAENLVQSVKQMKLSTELENSDEVQAVEMLEIVECDLEKRGQIEPALGNASVIICCIGASEKEVFDVTGPYRIDFLATKNLVDAATAAKVNHFIMGSSLGTNKFGFPAAILNLFWGVLCWKRKAEEALIASGLPYTIVRPGGMERPTDAYKETHNITVSPEDTLFGGQVSNLQVAELMACMAKNRSLSYCKVVEVIAETTSPLTPMEELLAKIPSQRAEPQKPITPEKSVPAAAKSIVSEKPSAPIIKAPVQTEAKETKPLSPYTAYDDLKPPTSPTPTLPTSQKVLTIVNGPTTPTTPDSQTSSSGVTVGTTATVSALEEVPRKQPLSPYSAYEDLRPPTSPTPTPPAVKKDLTIVDGLSTEISDAQISTSVETTAFTETLVSALEEVPRKPLSPYSAYEDLRPPTSPTPTPPTVKKDITIVDGLSTSDAQICTSVETTASTETLAGPKEVPITGPLCPYIAYDDLKPPSSPSPTPSGPKEVPSPSSTTKEVASQLSEGSNVTKTPDSSVVETNHSPNSIHYHSPYHMYEDLKPPTSPVPSPKRS